MLRTKGEYQCGRKGGFWFVGNKITALKTGNAGDQLVSKFVNGWMNASAILKNRYKICH